MNKKRVLLENKSGSAAQTGIKSATGVRPGIYATRLAEPHYGEGFQVVELADGLKMLDGKIG